MKRNMQITVECRTFDSLFPFDFSNFHLYLILTLTLASLSHSLISSPSLTLRPIHLDSLQANMTDRSVDMDLHSHSLSNVTSSGVSTPKTSTFLQSHQSDNLSVADPKTPPGQQVGAVLLVKSTPIGSTILGSGRQLEVHELVKVVEHFGRIARLLR
ncbi:hypothetical protein DL98DRAFT_112942 [Cadophora sp. DSE1049]|nr:hypothetical protein DL98DRAFT_112942 [Cadophora sp. DSE1049]